MKTRNKENFGIGKEEVFEDKMDEEIDRMLLEVDRMDISERRRRIQKRIDDGLEEETKKC